jgi:toxin ParE1/3/4
MRLSYSVAALRDLKAIYRQSFRQFGLAQADRYRAGLERSFRLIAEHPLASSEHAGYKRPLRVHFYQSHVIFYAIEDDIVRVVRVLHQQQDWQGIL